MNRFKKLFLLSLIFNVFLLGLLGGLVYRLGGLRYFIYRVQSKGLSALYEHRKTQFEQLPDTTNEIIFLGDSITEAGEWAEWLQNPAIKNRGIAGDTSSELLKRLEEVLRAQPKVIFLMIGVNDLLFVSKEKVLENYRKIINEIKAKSPGTKLYLQSVLPVNRDVSRIPIDNTTIVALNTGIQQLAKEFELQYLDIYTLLKNNKGQLDAQYTSDGIHLNGSAYLTWTTAIGQYLKDDF